MNAQRIRPSDRPTWKHLRRAAPRRRAEAPWPAAVRFALLWSIVAAGPVPRVDWVRGRPEAVALAGLIAAAVALHRLLERGTRWWSWLAPAALAAAATSIASHQLGFWSGAGLAIGGWAVSGRSPVPRFDPRVSREAPIGVLAMALVCSRWGRGDFRWLVPAVFVAVSCATVAGSSVVSPVLRRLGYRLGELIGVALSAALSAAVLVGTTVGTAVFGTRSPASESASDDQRWRLRSTDRTMRVERPWSSGEDQRSRGDRPLRWYAWFAALSVLCAGLGLTAWERRGSETPSAPRNDAAAEGGSSSTSSRASSPAPTHDPRPDSGGTTGADQPTIPTALADADWYPKYLADQQYAATWLDSFRQVGSEKLRDGISTYTTVIDGARRTWSPPPCGCQRRTVWMYGSATGFGLGQRDDHTIASELAKLAWRDGIALDITNRGVPGDQLGGQINRLAWDLSQGPQPDLVVHLAGWSDLNAANWLNSHGMGNVAQAIDTVALGFFADETVQRTIKQALGAGRARPPRPPGISVEDPSVAVGGPETVAAIAIDRFERALTMGRSLASARGLETFWFWEPMRLARPVAAGEPTRPDDAFNRDVIELTRERLPADVVDISDRLDPSEGPMFFDDSHYNERGAGAAAESIYAALRPALMSSPPAPVQPSGP